MRERPITPRLRWFTRHRRRSRQAGDTSLQLIGTRHVRIPPARVRPITPTDHQKAVRSADLSRVGARNSACGCSELIDRKQARLALGGVRPTRYQKRTRRHQRTSCGCSSMCPVLPENSASCGHLGFRSGIIDGAGTISRCCCRCSTAYSGACSVCWRCWSGVTCPHWPSPIDRGYRSPIRDPSVDGPTRTLRPQ